ncbi:Rz lytic protein [Rosenbergiella epipactidis]|uniref:Rz lytic protein n=1 Tax=Rosenbergiella epipactidis TaxID=1544694 RepID=UPI001F4DBE4E|nr:Rz lytic protein [Rosenbergiella epipactidis]
MLRLISILKGSIRYVIPVAIILMLWGLNVSNSQLKATNTRLEQLSDSKDEQINNLRAKNDNLADGVQQLTQAVTKQNAVMADVLAQRADTAEHNRELQNEIKRYLATDKCALSPVNSVAVSKLREAAEDSRVSSGKDSVPSNTSRPDKPAN